MRAVGVGLPPSGRLRADYWPSGNSANCRGRGRVGRFSRPPCGEDSSLRHNGGPARRAGGLLWTMNTDSSADKDGDRRHAQTPGRALSAPATRHTLQFIYTPLHGRITLRSPHETHRGRGGGGSGSSGGGGGGSGRARRRGGSAVAAPCADRDGNRRHARSWARSARALPHYSRETYRGRKGGGVGGSSGGSSGRTQRRGGAATAARAVAAPSAPERAASAHALDRLAREEASVAARGSAAAAASTRVVRVRRGGRAMANG